MSSPSSSTFSPLSLYIPRVFSNVSSKRIAAIFHNLDLGRVRKIDMIPRVNPNGDDYNMVFIHMWEWYENQNSYNFQERVLAGNGGARIVYDDPWFWIVLKNATPKTDAQLVLEEKIEKIAEDQLISDEKLTFACCCITELQLQIEALEAEYKQSSLIDTHTREAGWEIVEDDEGNEYYVFTPPNDGPVERANAVSPPPSPSIICCEGGGDDPVEIPEWLNDVDAQCASSSWQALHEEAEAFRNAFEKELGDENINTPPGFASWLADNGGSCSADAPVTSPTASTELLPKINPPPGFNPNQACELPPIKLPLENGQIEMDPVTGSYFVYNNVNGEHIWSSITDKPLKTAETWLDLEKALINADGDEELAAALKAWWLKSNHGKAVPTIPFFGFKDNK
jgi:hypothetical protein